MAYKILNDDKLMETKTFDDFAFEVRKALWGTGEWSLEPDYAKWEYKGFTCIASRNIVGAWCGYVKIPDGHPYYKKEDPNLDVHGGVTYNDFRTDFEGNQYYAIGFDCSHGDDVMPVMYNSRLLKKWMNDLPHFRPTYKNLEFVQKECQDMVDQLISE